QTVNVGVSNRTAAHGEAYTVTPTNCPSGPCTIAINIGGAIGTGSFGDAPSVVFQVQISGEGLMNRSGITGATVLNNAGTLARPADSPNVLAVGAVCARPAENYPLIRE